MSFGHGEGAGIWLIEVALWLCSHIVPGWWGDKDELLLMAAGLVLLQLWMCWWLVFAARWIEPGGGVGVTPSLLTTPALCTQVALKPFHWGKEVELKEDLFCWLKTYLLCCKGSTEIPLPAVPCPPPMLQLRECGSGTFRSLERAAFGKSTEYFLQTT